MQRRRLGGLDVSAVGLGPACLEGRIGPPDGVLHLRAVAEQPGGAAARNTRVGVGSLPPGRHHGAHRASSLRMQARGDSRPTPVNRVVYAALKPYMNGPPA